MPATTQKSYFVFDTALPGAPIPPVGATPGPGQVFMAKTATVNTVDAAQLLYLTTPAAADNVAYISGVVFTALTGNETPPAPPASGFVPGGYSAGSYLPVVPGSSYNNIPNATTQAIFP